MRGLIDRLEKIDESSQRLSYVPRSGHLLRVVRPGETNNLCNVALVNEPGIQSSAKLNEYMKTPSVRRSLFTPSAFGAIASGNEKWKTNCADGTRGSAIPTRCEGDWALNSTLCGSPELTRTVMRWWCVSVTKPVA